MSKRQILEYLLETNTSVSVTQMCVSLLVALVNLDLYDSVSFLLVVRGQEGALDLDGVQKAIREKTRTARLRMRSRSAGSDEVTFELRLKSKYEHDLVEAVGACAGVQSVNLVSYSGESIG